jgi:ABC-2 type transport system ATP-binding protein
VIVRDLRVDYGRRIAVNRLSIEIAPGEIFGLLGPNGAGKTSTFRAMATLQEPTHGEIILGGRDARTAPEQARAILAYMPDLAPLPADLKAEEYLKFFAECHGFYGEARDLRVGECLEAVDLCDRRHEFCRQLSLGMRQRLVLASSLLHRPRVLILDEPASGMDPIARAALREALRRQAAGGATIVLSSHVLSELQDLCTSIGLMREGKLIDSGPLREVLQRQGTRARRLRLRTVISSEALREWLAGPDGLPNSAPRLVQRDVECDFSGGDVEQAEFFQRLGAAGLGVVSMREVETSIEDVVLGLNKNGENK